MTFASPMTSPLRLLIADDHRVVRAGLRALLEGEPDIEVTEEAGSGEEAVQLLTAKAPGLPVVMLTSYSSRVDVVRALEAGARGYVLKAGPLEELFRAVRSAAAGGMGLAPEIVGDLVGQAADRRSDLTRREEEVVRLMADGHSNRTIAESLFLSEATIKSHLVRICRELGVDNRAAAVSEAARRGFLDLTP
ncbi:response regulator transcription factor [Streptomyces pseudovenezuelae]|nr:response regulator transcription factor [Streptomyces pseudovenezuelae]